jgi:hypothetical protein
MKTLKWLKYITMIAMTGQEKLWTDIICSTRCPDFEVSSLYPHASVLQYHWQVLNILKTLQQLEKITTDIQTELPWCICQHIPIANNSKGCCLNHCTTDPYTLSFDMNVQLVTASFNGLEMLTARHWVQLVSIISQHLPLHSIPLVLNSVGHIGVGTVV